MTPKIEEILGFNTSKSKDTENVVRRFYVTADTPETAKNAFESFAYGLAVPTGLELGSVDLDEEKNGSGIYFGTITFTSPNPKIKTRLSPSLSEVFGEKRAQGRKSESFERTFRIKAATATAAKNILQNAVMPNDGRLHVNDISVDEEQDGSGQNNYVTEISVDEDSGGADRVYAGRVRRS
ncbi:MAG: hypothetical protein LBT46_12370, partial [Planctomycetaceae bacterium]|nr:hypothetical protein [Planctomycetaceae bacterium]